MKIFVPIVVVLVAFFCVMVLGLERSIHRAEFMNTMSELKEANSDLQKHGAFTNHFRDVNIYSYTNLLTIAGTNYQCALAVDGGSSGDRGFLAITTNDVFVWVDYKRGLIPLVKPRIFPPGL